MATDVGEVITRSVVITDATGTPVDADATPTWSVTLPDGTAGVSPTVEHGGVGEYFVNFETSQAGLHADAWAAVVNGHVARFAADSFYVRPDSPPPILSLAEARQLLNLGVSYDRDEQLREYIDAATELCEAHTGRAYRLRSVTHEVVGSAGVIILPHVPVHDVTSVTCDGSAVTGWTLDKHAGILRAPNGFAAATTITYRAGATVVPARVRQAVRVTLQHLWSTQGGASGGPRRSTGMDVNAAGATPWSLPRAAEELLLPDVRLGVA